MAFLQKIQNLYYLLGDADSIEAISKLRRKIKIVDEQEVLSKIIVNNNAIPDQKDPNIIKFKEFAKKYKVAIEYQDNPNILIHSLKRIETPIKIFKNVQINKTVFDQSKLSIGNKYELLSTQMTELFESMYDIEYLKELSRKFDIFLQECEDTLHAMKAIVFSPIISTSFNNAKKAIVHMLCLATIADLINSILENIENPNIENESKAHFSVLFKKKSIIQVNNDIKKMKEISPLSAKYEQKQLMKERKKRLEESLSHITAIDHPYQQIERLELENSKLMKLYHASTTTKTELEGILMDNKNLQEVISHLEKEIDIMHTNLPNKKKSK